MRTERLIGAIGQPAAPSEEKCISLIGQNRKQQLLGETKTQVVSQRRWILNAGRGWGPGGQIPERGHPGYGGTESWFLDPGVGRIGSPGLATWPPSWGGRGCLTAHMVGSLYISTRTFIRMLYFETSSHLVYLHQCNILQFNDLN